MKSVEGPGDKVFFFFFLYPLCYISVTALLLLRYCLATTPLLLYDCSANAPLLLRYCSVTGLYYCPLLLLCYCSGTDFLTFCYCMLCYCTVAALVLHRHLYVTASLLLVYLYVIAS